MTMNPDDYKSDIDIVKILEEFYDYQKNTRATEEKVEEEIRLKEFFSRDTRSVAIEYLEKNNTQMKLLSVQKEVHHKRVTTINSRVVSLEAELKALEEELKSNEDDIANIMDKQEEIVDNYLNKN